MSAASTDNSNSNDYDEKGPLHVLMDMPAAENKRLNKRVQNDYITRRAKVYGIKEKEVSPIWAGVRKVERSLVLCCEKLEDLPEELPGERMPFSSTRSGKGFYPLIGGGALDVGKEVEFLRVLASDCHSLSSRSLALAILERTLDARQMDAEEAENQAASNDTPLETKNPSDRMEEDVKVEEDAEEDGHEAETGQKRRSHRKSKQELKYKRTKRKHLNEEEKSDSSQIKKFDHKKWKRIEQFLAAGGLKVLGRWLEESCDEVYVTKRKKAGGEPVLDVEPSPTRSLILPLLRFLERIPFDKALVIESKINKEIRKAEKQIDEILRKAEQKQHHRDDLKGWTTDLSKSGTKGLLVVKDAIKELKGTWQIHSKQKSDAVDDAIDDPFQVLRETLKERLGAVAEYQAGTGPRPEWMVTVEEKKEKPKKTQAELAAKERLAEKECMTKQNSNHEQLLREAQRKHREYVAMLRKKVKEHTNNGPSSDFKRDPNARRVQWKDGMRSKDYRNRKKLEEVFFFDKSTPASIDIDEGVKDGQEHHAVPIVPTINVPPELAETSAPSTTVTDPMDTQEYGTRV